MRTGTVGGRRPCSSRTRPTRHRKRSAISPRHCPRHRRRAKPEGYGHPDAPQGAGTDRRGQPQPAPGGGPGVDAPRVRPVDRGPQLRTPRRRAVVGRAVDALADRPDGVGGEPPHRGQPAELPPRGGAGVRPRERVGRVGQPLDGRGGPARVLHPRLPAGHARRRPRRARACPHADDGDRLRLRREGAAERLRLRVVPGARHPGLTPQHRQDHRGPHRREAAHSRGQGREPAHDLLPQHRRGRAADRARPHDAGDHRRGRSTSRCRAR